MDAGEVAETLKAALPEAERQADEEICAEAVAKLRGIAAEGLEAYRDVADAWNGFLARLSDFNEVQKRHEEVRHREHFPSWRRLTSEQNRGMEPLQVTNQNHLAVRDGGGEFLIDHKRLREWLPNRQLLGHLSQKSAARPLAEGEFLTTAAREGE